MEAENKIENQTPGLEKPQTGIPADLQYADPVDPYDVTWVESLEHRDNFGPGQAKLRKKKRRRRRIRKFFTTVAVLAGLYLFAVYTNIPFIANLRTLYIETAMGTMTHQWLATYFIPKGVIDEVMAEIDAAKASQAELVSVWDTEEEFETTEFFETETEEVVVSEEDAFYEKFWELDTESFRSYIASNPDVIADGYDHLLIEDLSGNLDLTDANGNRILVVNAENNLLIMRVSGNDYVGKLAIVKDSAQVDLLKAESFGSFGDHITTFGSRENVLVAVNASRFYDPGGHGTGASITGSMVLDGVEYGSTHGGDWKFFGMKNDNRFYITNRSATDISEYRWGLECIPALVVNGASVVDGSFGMGVQPRTSIGQTADGGFMFFVVDGRQVGYSLGCTVAECARVMMAYGCYQGANMDGGSSSVMTYKGELITKSSSASGTGRYTPNALAFMTSDWAQ